MKFDPPRPARPGWKLATACTMIAGGLYLLLGTGQQGDDGTRPGSSPASSPAPVQARPTPAPPAADALDEALGDMARLFELGIAGDLHVDVDTKAALELLVAEIQRQRVPDVLRRIDTSLRAGLPTQAAEEALAMVHNYLAYTQSSARAARNRPLPDSVEAWRAQLNEDLALRGRFFDPATQQALFGPQEAYTRYAMEVHAINADPQLSQAAKTQRIRALYEQLEPEAAAIGEPPSQAGAALEQQIGTQREQEAIALHTMDMPPGL
jgi:hypothetical protein